MINNASIWGALADAARNDVFHFVNRGAPTNGTTGKGIAGRGSLLTDLLTGNLYINTGTISNPTWGASTRGIGDTANVWASNFQNGQGVPLADNQPSVTLDSGIRVFGPGLVDNDSGLVVSITPEGSIGMMQASANAGEAIAVGAGLSGSLPYKPAINGPLSLQVQVAMIPDHLSRKFFLGYVGSVPDNLIAPESFSAGNFTINQANMVGLVTDTGIGTTRDFYALSNKLNATPIVPAIGALLAAQFPVSPTFVTLKIAVGVDGTATFYVDGVLVKTIPEALDPNVAVAPVLLLGNTANGAVRQMNVKQFISLGS